jgi:Flp pilus assembly protein TadD
MPRLAALAAALLMGACSTIQPLTAMGRVRLALARDLAVRGEHGQAVALVQQIHEDGTRTPETLTLRGKMLRERGIYDEAEADLREALKLDSGHAPAHDALAVLYDLQDRPALAKTHHLRAIELDERNATFRNNWGYALLRRGKVAEAIEALREAVRLAPDSPRCRNNLGFAHARGGDFARATQQFELAGSPAEAHNNLGVAYEAAGNLPQAFEAYLEAVRLDPALNEARANLLHVARALERAIPPDVASRAKDHAGRTQ